MKNEKFKVIIKDRYKLARLAVTYNGYQFSTIPLYTADQMRQIAQVLLDKASEMELTDNETG